MSQGISASLNGVNLLISASTVEVGIQRTIAHKLTRIINQGRHPIRASAKNTERLFI